MAVFCNNSCLFNCKTYYSNGIHRKEKKKNAKKKATKLYLSERKYDKRGKRWYKDKAVKLPGALQGKTDW